jgi:cysteine desulfurase
MAVYLDHAATSPIRPEVLLRYTADLALVGNPSSVHGFGQRARMVVEDARESLADTLGCHRSEIIFTSGGTEADNLAIKGLFWARNNADARRRLIVSAASEHHAVLDALEWLEAHGPAEQRAQLHLLELDANGMFDLADLEKFLAERSDEIALISLMWANNETGVVWPIAEVSKLAAKFAVPVHSDAVAALGHVPVDFADSGLSLMSVSGHKIGAPVGIGALVVRRDVNLVPVNHGGGHERKLRSGTLNAVGASAFALAAAAASATLQERAKRDSELKQQLISGVRNLVSNVEVTAPSVSTLPSTVHLSFAGCPGDSILVLLDMAGVAVSNGAACQAGVIGASHVMLAMGRSEQAASECIRISFGYDTTERDIEEFLAALPAAYEGARKAGDAA